jgi:gentisate 1,2-dioxygenase
MEGSGAYTAVNGRKAYMAPGDFIVTPSWTWHEHAHEGRGPTVWLDVLDVAVIHLFNATFTEQWPGERGPSEQLPSESRDGRNVAPVGDARGTDAAPYFSYPYAHVREALEGLQRSGALDACHALKRDYLNPATGGPAIPTLTTSMQLYPAGFESEPYKSTAGTIYCVVEGRGVVTIEDGRGVATARDFEPWDIFVVPSWRTFTVRADEDSTIFGASDRVIQTKLGFWREQRGA